MFCIRPNGPTISVVAGARHPPNCHITGHKLGDNSQDFKQNFIAMWKTQSFSHYNWGDISFYLANQLPQVVKAQVRLYYRPK